VRLRPQARLGRGRAGEGWLAEGGLGRVQAGEGGLGREQAGEGWLAEGGLHFAHTKAHMGRCRRGLVVRAQVTDPRYSRHAFDGDGMVCSFAFQGGKCYFRNKFVRTEGFVAEQVGGCWHWSPRSRLRAG